MKLDAPLGSSILGERISEKRSHVDERGECRGSKQHITSSRKWCLKFKSLSKLTPIFYSEIAGDTIGA